MKARKTPLDKEDIELGMRIRSHPAWAGDHGFEGEQLTTWRRQRTWALNKIAAILKTGPKAKERNTVDYYYSCRMPTCPVRVGDKSFGTYSGKYVTTAAREWLNGYPMTAANWLTRASEEFTKEHPEEVEHQVKEAGDNEPD